MKQIRIAMAQTLGHRWNEKYLNIPIAQQMVDKAGQAGAQLVCFPEGFPGPYYQQTNWSAMESSSERARSNNIFVVFGCCERDETEQGDAYHITEKIIGPDGQLIDSYHRIQPTPETVNRVLTGEKAISPGNRLVTFDVHGAKVGVLICSEIFTPELARLYALEGVEVLLAPIGALVYELRETWRTVLWARAIENLCYVGTCQGLFGMEDGLALIAGPENILAESRVPELVIADCDLDRIRWLRSQEESLQLPKPYKVVPGLLEMRRPEIFGKLSDENMPHYNFYSFRQRNQKPEGG